jgi:hypothetical protein
MSARPVTFVSPRTEWLYHQYGNLKRFRNVIPERYRAAIERKHQSLWAEPEVVDEDCFCERCEEITPELIGCDACDQWLCFSCAEILMVPDGQWFCPRCTKTD